MQLTEDKGNAANQIQAHTDGQIKVNGDFYDKSLLITPNTLITDWPPQHLNELTNTHLQAIISLQPDIVLLGTGTHFIMPTAELLAPLYDAQLGVESMDTGAACRTYTALMAEGRNVVAALLIG